MKQAAESAGLPSAADLDADADEKRAAELTQHFMGKLAREADLP